MNKEANQYGYGYKQCGCLCCEERRQQDKKWEAMKEPNRDGHPGSVDYMGGSDYSDTDEPDGIPTTAGKLLLNSLYGKLGAKEPCEDVPHIEWADYAALREKYGEAVKQLDELRHAMRVVCRIL